MGVYYAHFLLFIKIFMGNKSFMANKLKYIAPAIIDEIKIEMDGSILAASHVNMVIEDDVEVVTMGQEVDSWEQQW